MPGWAACCGSLQLGAIVPRNSPTMPESSSRRRGWTTPLFAENRVEGVARTRPFAAWINPFDFLHHPHGLGCSHISFVNSIWEWEILPIFPKRWAWTKLGALYEQVFDLPIHYQKCAFPVAARHGKRCHLYRYSPCAIIQNEIANLLYLFLLVLASTIVKTKLGSRLIFFLFWSMARRPIFGSHSGKSTIGCFEWADGLRARLTELYQRYAYMTLII